MRLNYTLYLTGLKNIHKVPESSINEVLLATFHKQEQKSLGFWVFFVVLQWVIQLSLKQLMGQVLDNLVFLSETWNVSFHHVIHTVANDMNQIVFTVFQNSVPYL